MSGWLYQSGILNWTGHVFYGGSIRSDGVELVLLCLREIAAAVPEVEGRFFVDDDAWGHTEALFAALAELLKC